MGAPLEIASRVNYGGGSDLAEASRTLMILDLFVHYAVARSISVIG